jgi:GT2 family glycosyltransferase
LERDNEPRVAIVICNWNGREDTRECLSSLERLNYPNYEIILVDNGSTDGSAQIFRESYGEEPRIRLLELEDNLGFAGGSNSGIAQGLRSGASYILLLNNDTVVDENFLTELIKAAGSDGEIGIVGPKVYQFGRDNTLESAGCRGISFLAQPVLRGNGQEDQGQYDQEAEVTYISGCSLLIKSEVIDAIGLLDPDYFAYFEDWDWNLRARRAGYRILYVPGARIWHKSSRSTGWKSPRYYYYHTRSRLLFARKNIGWLGFFFLFLPYFLLYRVFLLLAILSLKGEGEAVWAVLRGLRWHLASGNSREGQGI